MSDTGQDALQLISRLVDARRETTSLDEPARQARLAEVLDRELGGQDPKSADALIERARAHVVGQARLRSERLDEQSRRIAELEAELESARGDMQELSKRAERGVQLEAELTTLREKNESLAGKESALDARVRELEDALEARPAEAPAPPPPPAPPGSDAGRLDAIKEALRAAAEGRPATDAEAALPERDGRFLALLRELLSFALELDRGVQAFLMELEVGPAMDTVQIRGYQRQVTQRFCEGLDDAAGSLDALRELLERNRRFLILLNEAYRGAIPLGSQELLAELQPAKVLEGTKGKGLLKLANYEGAFKELDRCHADLTALPPSELLARFYTEPFQARLRELLGR